jgi:hypothetical protein
MHHSRKRDQAAKMAAVENLSQKAFAVSMGLVNEVCWLRVSGERNCAISPQSYCGEPKTFHYYHIYTCDSSEHDK